jgi:hypothetical protein
MAGRTTILITYDLARATAGDYVVAFGSRAQSGPSAGRQVTNPALAVDADYSVTQVPAVRRCGRFCIQKDHFIQTNCESCCGDLYQPLIRVREAVFASRLKSMQGRTATGCFRAGTAV